MIPDVLEIQFTMQLLFTYDTTILNTTFSYCHF